MESHGFGGTGLVVWTIRVKVLLKNLRQCLLASITWNYVLPKTDMCQVSTLMKLFVIVRFSLTLYPPRSIVNAETVSTTKGSGEYIYDYSKLGIVGSDTEYSPLSYWKIQSEKDEAPMYVETKTTELINYPKRPIKTYKAVSTKLGNFYGGIDDGCTLTHMRTQVEGSTDTLAGVTCPSGEAMVGWKFNIPANYKVDKASYTM